MPETRFEEKVRSSLREAADMKPFDPQTVGAAARRARRRLQRDAVVVGIFAVLALAAIVRGVPFADTSTPAAPPVRVGDEVITFVEGRMVKTIHADGSHEMTVASPCTKQSCSVGGISWSPNGSELALSTSSANGNKDPLYVVQSNGTGLRVLRDCPAGPPTWSPDGSRIATPHSGTAPLPNGQRFLLRPRFYMCSPEGGVAQWRSSWTTWGPAMSWSPDGREFAFINFRQQIVVQSADGTSRRVIGRAAGGGPLPFDEIAWSPDGSHIAYTAWSGWYRSHSHHGHQSAQLWVVNPDGSDPHVVLQAPWIVHPAWSPDSSQIAVDAMLHKAKTTSLVLMAPDGSGVTTLAGVGGWPTWDPSGTVLATVVGHAIVLVPADGSLVQTVPTSIRHPNYGVPPVWRPASS